MSHKEIKEENRIKIDYKNLKIINHSLSHIQNYNLPK